MTRDPNDYPKDHKPGTHWATDIAWNIMDRIPHGAITDNERDFIAGLIAGSLIEARKLGARAGEGPEVKIHDHVINALIEAFQRGK